MHLAQSEEEGEGGNWRPAAGHLSEEALCRDCKPMVRAAACQGSRLRVGLASASTCHTAG